MMNFNRKITSMNFKIQLQNIHGMPKAISFVDLYKNIELLLGSTCQTPKINLVNNPTTPTNGNIGIKQCFISYLELVNINNKFLVDVVGSVMQFDTHDHNFKEHLQYFKAKDKKVH